MTAITVEQFLSSPSDPEDEEVDLEQRDNSAVVVPRQPLESIAHSLDRLLAIAEHHELEETEADRLREAHGDLEAKHAVLFDLVEEIEAIVKPSTSKLAITVREAVGRWRGVEPEAAPVEPAGAPGVEPQPGPPANEAGIEEWREYARSQGFQGPDVDSANRSQIRTMLGLAHFAGSDGAGA